MRHTDKDSDNDRSGGIYGHTYVRVWATTHILWVGLGLNFLSEITIKVIPVSR